MLCSTLQLNVEPIGDTSGDGNILVGTIAERAVEFRITKVQLQSGILDFAERQAVHLVPGRRVIGAAIAFANVGGNRDVIRQIQTNSPAQALKKVLIQKTCADQNRIKGRQVAQVIVVQVQSNQTNRMLAYAG